MVFVHPAAPKDRWETSGGTVWYYEDGYKLRHSTVTHKDLHDPTLGFKFKELKK